jgi:uncharacterized integral membrane protein
MTVALITIIILAVVSVVFAVQNSAVITVSFLAWQVDASLALILMITLVVGILIGYLAGLPSVWRRSSETRQLRRQVEDLQQATAVRDTPEVTGDGDGGEPDRSV